MSEIQAVIVTLLGAVGGFLVARATAHKMSAEGNAISAKAFTDLADQVQGLIRDNSELHRQMQELRMTLVEKERRISDLAQEVEALRRRKV